MNMRRLWAVLYARNLEFLRDRSTLAFNVVLPLVLVLAFGLIWGGQARPMFKVGVIAAPDAALTAELHPFLEAKFVGFYRVEPEVIDATVRKVERHQVDLLVDLREAPRYWVNQDSPKGYLAEKLLLESANGVATRQPVTGAAVRFVDYLLPGILGMNMMFSCLFGVGFVVVRYRKNGFLRRLNATPLTAAEFGAAQIFSRLGLTLGVTIMIYALLAWMIDFRNDGSLALLFLTAVLGAIAMTSLGFLVAARFTSEELASGVINLLTWPMMFLSGVWFSLEGSPRWLQMGAEILPLTHMLTAARAIMLDGAGLADVGLRLLVLAGMSALFLILAAASFRWRPD